jgi:Sulfotransferase family
MYRRCDVRTATLIQQFNRRDNSLCRTALAECRAMPQLLRRQPIHGNRSRDRAGGLRHSPGVRRQRRAPMRGAASVPRRQRSMFRRETRICTNVIRIARVQVDYLLIGVAHLGGAPMKPPVFVVGFPRSGTTLLYSMFMAAGGFAVYRKETYFYHLAAGFPRVLTERTRRRFKQEYLAGYLGKVPGLPVEHYVDRALDACRTYEKILPRLMDAITRGQGMERWVEGTPTHVLYMREIKRAIPNALFVHVIRDGRDCALSYDRQGWTSTLPSDRRHRAGVAALYWEFMVRAGRHFRREYPHHCLEVRFEDLIEHPRETLRRIGEFLHHDLDYDRMVQNPIHCLKAPNTSFRHSRDTNFSPVGRWREKEVAADVAMCESLVGPYLDELGYRCAQSDRRGNLTLGAHLIRASYLGYFSAKRRLRARTPLGRVLTSTRIWAEQPRAGEPPIHPIASVAAATLATPARGVASA